MDRPFQGQLPSTTQDGQGHYHFIYFSCWFLAVLGLHWALTVARGLLFRRHRRASLVEHGLESAQAQ